MYIIKLAIKLAIKLNSLTLLIKSLLINNQCI